MKKKKIKIIYAVFLSILVYFASTLICYSVMYDKPILNFFDNKNGFQEQTDSLISMLGVLTSFIFIIIYSVYKKKDKN